MDFGFVCHFFVCVSLFLSIAKPKACKNQNGIPFQFRAVAANLKIFDSPRLLFFLCLFLWFLLSVCFVFASSFVITQLSYHTKWFHLRILSFTFLVKRRFALHKRKKKCQPYRKMKWIRDDQHMFYVMTDKMDSRRTSIKFV